MTWQAYQPAALLIGIPLAVAFLLPFINILFGKRKFVPTFVGVGLALFQLLFGFLVVLPKAMDNSCLCPVLNPLWELLFG